MHIKRTIVQIFSFISFVGLLMYSYLSRHNELTQLRIAIPKMVEENRQLMEEIARVQFYVDKFEDPQHLMELASLPEFTHLKHPFFDNVLTVEEGLAIAEKEKKDSITNFPFSVPLGKQ